MSQPIRVAGGGLSGLAVAVLLARQGVGVEVHDRRKGGGGRFHEGWQVLENGTSDLDALDELRALGLEPSFAMVPARHAVFLDGLGGRHEVSSREPYAYFTRRGAGAGSLDDWLRRLALDAGAVVHDEGEAPDGATVIATGPRQADGVAREVVFASNLADTVAVLFDPQVTPTGYAYLFCLDGHATFGVAQVRRVRGLARAQERAWERFEHEFGPFTVDRRHEGGQFMNFSLPRRLRGRDGRWYAGEAAGVQDFLFGLGNRLALRSAALVAAGVTGRWDEGAFRAGIARPMRQTVALRFAYERLGRGGFARFCATAARRDFRRLLIGMQRPRALGGLLAHVVMAAWRERRGCRHGELCTWCRRRER